MAIDLGHARLPYILMIRGPVPVVPFYLMKFKSLENEIYFFKAVPVVPFYLMKFKSLEK